FKRVMSRGRSELSPRLSATTSRLSQWIIKFTNSRGSVVSQGVHRRENRPASTSPIAGVGGICDTESICLGDGPEGEAKILSRLSRVPLGALLKPEELSRAALYLSDDSAGI